MRVPVKLQDCGSAAERQAAKHEKFNAFKMRIPDSDHVTRVVAHNALPVSFGKVVSAMGHAAMFRDFTSECVAE